METNTNNLSDIISAGQLLRILDTDPREISTLCQKACLRPKKDGFGNVYFSSSDVEVLKKVKELYEQTRKIQSEKEGYPVIDANAPVKPKKVLRAEPEKFEFEEKVKQNKQKNFELPVSMQTGVASTKTESAVIKKMDDMEASIVSKMSDLLSEKLDGLDEVIVELIKAKTENENLRQKVNDLNKENFNLKSELASFKHVTMGVYIKKAPDSFNF